MLFCYSVAIVLLLMNSSDGFSQTDDFSVSDIDLSLELSNPLVFKFHGLAKTSSPIVVGAEKKWILIYLEYVPSLKKSTDLTGFDDLIINFKVAIPGKTNTVNILTTSITYPFVNFDGQKKYEIVFIPPKILSKILPENIKMNDSLLKHIIVKANFTMNNKTIGVGYSSNTDVSAGDPFNKLEEISTAKVIPNSIYTRAATPWINIDFDRYELIKL